MAMQEIEEVPAETLSYTERSMAVAGNPLFRKKKSFLKKKSFTEKKKKKKKTSNMDDAPKVDGQKVDAMLQQLREESRKRNAARREMVEEEEREEVVWPPVRTFEELALGAIRSKRNLPEDFDHSLKEQYLSDADFKKTFGMSRDVFNSMVKWKRKAEKMKHNLF